MNYIAIDLEFNQPTSGSKLGSWKSRYIKNEVIEIGASLLDSSLKFKRGFKVYIKPYFQPTINQHVLELLGFQNQDYININGTRFKHAMELFKHFVGQDDFIFLVWGNNDIKVLIQHCGVTNIDYTWIKNKKNIDIQKYYMLYTEKNQMPSLKKALVEQQIQYEEKVIHRAFNDSLNTAKIAQKIGLDFILDEKLLIRTVDTPDKLRNEVKNRIKCPNCGRFTPTTDTSKTRIEKELFIINKLNCCNKCKLIIDTEFRMHRKSNVITNKTRTTHINNKVAVKIFKEKFK